MFSSSTTSELPRVISSLKRLISVAEVNKKHIHLKRKRAFAFSKVYTVNNIQQLLFINKDKINVFHADLVNSSTAHFCKSKDLLALNVCCVTIVSRIIVYITMCKILENVKY